MNKHPNKFFKFCQRCRTWNHRDNYGVVETKLGFRKDRLCSPCRYDKNALREASAAKFKIFKPSDLRTKELALIPNPFEKSTVIMPEILDHHWIGCV